MNEMARVKRWHHHRLRQEGSGPAVILVGGGLDDGAENVPCSRRALHGYTMPVGDAARAACRAPSPWSGRSRTWMR